MNRFLPLFACSLGWLLCAGPIARADMTPAPNAQWSYNFSPHMKNNQVLATDGLSGVNFTNEPTKNATGTSDVVVSNLKVFSNSASPVGFGSGGGYSVGLTLTDSASGATASYLFNNTLGGNLSATSANVTTSIPHFSGTVTANGKTISFSGMTAPTVALGNFNYEVTMTTFVPPSPPNASNAGSIGAHVSVTTGIIVPATVPEPPALVLSGLGLALAGLAAVRRKRRPSLAAVLA
jgi:hypothetical protein